MTNMSTFTKLQATSTKANVNMASGTQFPQEVHSCHCLGPFQLPCWGPIITLTSFPGFHSINSFLFHSASEPFLWPHPDFVNSPELPYCSCKLPIPLHGIPSHSFTWYSAHICGVNGSVNSSVAQIWWQAWEGCAGWREHQIDSAEVGVYKVNGRQQRDQPR